MIRLGDILNYIDEAAPVPFSYIYKHFEVQPERITCQMKRLRDRGLAKRIYPEGPRPLWILGKAGADKLDYYQAHGYFK